MELLVKRVSSLIVLTLFFFSVSAENTIFEIVNRIKKRNPSDCSLASYHRSSDHYRVICIGKNLNRYLYRIPLTVDSNSSFLIDEDHYLNIDNGLDSIFLAGEFLGRAVKKINSSKDHQSDEPHILSLPGQPKLTLRLLDNETTPELGPFFRVVVDHIRHADHEVGSYTTRIINCKNDTYFKISSGRSTEDMEKNYQPPGNIQPISKKSILYSLRRSVCGEKEPVEINEEDILK